MNCFVYLLTGPNGKQYVGVSSNPVRRFQEHKVADSLIGRSIRKHGWDNFNVQYVCQGEEEYAFEIEQRTTRILNTVSPNGYNLVDGGKGGRKLSEESKKKIGDIQRGKKRGPLSEQTKRKIAEANRGTKPSALAVARTIETKTGTKQSTETILKKSLKLKGLKRSQETKDLMSRVRTGEKRSDESKERMRQAHLGKTHSDETRTKMSSAAVGKSKSKETRARMSAASMQRAAKRWGLQNLDKTVNINETISTSP